MVYFFLLHQAIFCSFERTHLLLDLAVMATLPSGIDLSKTPGAPNPSGGEPDFVDPPSLAPAVTGVGATMIILGAIFVTARIYSNLYAARKIGWDDCKKPDHISLRTTG